MDAIFQANYRVYQITSPYHNGKVNFFIVEEPDGLTLIDAGPSTEESWDILKRSLDEIGHPLSELNRILITHHHHDHIGLINRISSYRDVPVFAHPLAILRLKRDPEFLSSRVEFFETLYRQMGCGELGDQYIERLKNTLQVNGHLKIHTEIIPITEKMTQNVEQFEIVEVPGHAPDQLMYYDRNHKLLFSGDHLLPNIASNAIVEPDVDGNRMATLVMYRNSLMKCQDLQVSMALPGHGKPFCEYDDLIQSRLSRIEEKAAKLEALIEKTSKTAFDLARQYYPKEYVLQFPLVMSSVIGSLDFLEINGRIEKKLKNDIWYYMKTKRSLL
jgi:glyoxylase-like metal-dependent hydrolase (beta-lactamase superfamily II)